MAGPIIIDDSVTVINDGTTVDNVEGKNPQVDPIITAVDNVEPGKTDDVNPAKDVDPIIATVDSFDDTTTTDGDSTMVLDPIFNETSSSSLMIVEDIASTSTGPVIPAKDVVAIFNAAANGLNTSTLIGNLNPLLASTPITARPTDVEPDELFNTMVKDRKQRRRGAKLNRAARKKNRKAALERNGITAALAAPSPVMKNRSTFMCIEILEQIQKFAVKRKIDRNRPEFWRTKDGIALTDMFCKYARGPRRELAARQVVNWRIGAEQKADNLGRLFYNSENDNKADA